MNQEKEKKLLDSNPEKLLGPNSLEVCNSLDYRTMDIRQLGKMPSLSFVFLLGVYKRCIVAHDQAKRKITTLKYTLPAQFHSSYYIFNC